MDSEELGKSPVIKMAGSDGHTYETTADDAHNMALAAREEGVQLKAFIKTKDAEGNIREISPFDGAALKDAEDRGDTRYVESAEEPDYFSAEALKAGAARFAIGVVNPWDWLRGIGTAAGTVFRGFAKGVVGTGIKAFQGAAHLGESLTNAITGDDDHEFSEFIGKVNEGFEKTVDFLTPDLFEKTGEYDGVEGAKEATGAVKSVAEMVANVKGIGTLTKVMRASGATAKAAHAATGALFGAGKYGEVASDENGPGGAEQQAAALVAGAADAVIFGLWNPFKIGAKYLKSMKPLLQATRMEAAKRFLAQATNSGLSMAAVEAVKQGAETTAGNLAVGTSGENRSEWSERTMGEVVKSIGAQFLVGSAFVAIDPLEQIPGRIKYGLARKSQGDVEEGLNDKMRVAMSYQVERNRKDICPKYHAQAVYAYNRFVKQGGRAEGFKEGLSQAPDVRRVNDDGSVVFDDGSVWRPDPRMREGNAYTGATITVSDGTVLSESGELLGYRPRREATQTDRVVITNDRTKPDESGSRERVSIEKPESNAMLVLQQIDDGKLPVADIAIGDIEAINPTENGSEITEWDAAKAKPIIVFEDLEGGLHAATGGKRLAMATASGEESIKAVIVREADGWTRQDASRLNDIENLRDGHATMKNVVEAVESLGIDQVAEMAGWHQKMGSGEFASKIRRGLAVVQKATPELKDALINGRISEEFAYNATQTLSMERVGEGWETAQKAVAELIGKVGPEELDAVLWGLKGRLTERSSAINVDWDAAIAEERAKYNAKKGGKDGQVDSDAVLIETDDGELKTLGEMEADLNKPRAGEAQGGADGAQTLYQAAEGAAINKAAELRPVEGEAGAFTSLSHPEARFTIDGSTHTIAVDGISVMDFEPSRIEQTAALVAKVEAHAATHGLKIGFYDDTTRALWETVKKNIRQEGHEAYSAKRMEAKRQTLVDHLSKSGLATEVVQTKGEFDKLAAELNGRPLTTGEEVYGFCDIKTGKVYLNPDFFATRQGLDAPLHEFGHLGIIATEKTNKAVYDQGMKLANELLEGGTDRTSGGSRTGVAEIVDFILNDEYYSKRSRQEQAEELLAQLIGKRGADALKAETDKSVIAKVKSWLVEFWNGFGKALGLKDITPEEAERMTLEDVADAIRAEMLGGGKYGEGFKAVEFAEGGARTATRPERVKRRLTGRRKAVDEFVSMMGGGEDPTNTETDMLALWVDNGGRLFDAMPYEIATGYSKGKTGVKKTRSTVADEFAESTAFYKDLDAAQRKVFFGTEKLETGPIGESFRQRLEEAGITRFTNEDGTVDYEAAIREFKRQWTNYERGKEILKERSDYDEARAKAFVEEMERAEQAAYDEISAEEAAARAQMDAADEATAAQIAADLEAGRFSIAGKTGAKNMRLKGAADAESMEKAGADCEEIWRKTGWWRGKDGKWRVEIPDLRMKDAKAIERKWVKRSLHEGEVYALFLRDLIDAKDLFKAYPDLADIKVHVFKSKKSNEAAAYYSSSDSIDIYGVESATNLMKRRSDLAHEIQHAIQEREGFAKGGTPEEVAEFVKNMESKQRIWAYKLDVEETAKELGTSNPYEIEKAILAKLGVKNHERIAELVKEGWIPNKAGRDKGYNLFARGYDKEGYKEAYDEYLGEMRKSGRALWWHGSPIELYKRLSGETEARNAAKRLSMSPEERAATPPWETEDVPEDRQIIRFSRGGIFTGTAADYANRSRQGGKDDGPSLKKIGTGEGSQVYGWGLYGSTVRGVAEGYAKTAKSADKIAHNMLKAYGRKRAIATMKDGLRKGYYSGIHSELIPEAIKILEEGKEKASSDHLYEQTWFTNREPGDESHLLKWYEPISKETWDIIREGERANGSLVKDGDTMLGLNGNYVLEQNGKPVYPGSTTGQSFYKDLAIVLGSPKAASEYLAKIGIDGVKYPVDSFGGKGVKNGDKVGWNYVSFRDDNIRVDHKWRDGQLRFSRAVKPSALGDGKQRYYEVPFDKAVDKIVKNKKPVSDEHVFISETPDVFREIGLPSLPVMMNQSHVLSCYFGQGEGVKAGNMHGLGAKLKSLPKAIAKPMMVIANDSNPSSSVIAIVKMQDRDGHTVIAPVEINGIGRSNAGPITANIVKSAFGKKNLWSEKVAKALRDEVDGKVAVFYIDSNEARQISNRLAREAFNFGKSERQLLSVTKGTVHSIADFGSPVKGVGAQKDSRQFKNWFGDSKVVDANGEPLVVWHGTDGNFTEFKQEEMREREGSFFFAENREDAKAYSGSGKVMPVYVNLRKPFDYENGTVPEAYKERWRNVKDKREQVAILKELGYDGWLANFENGKGWGEISAFYPNQIKSATDNIGTFDPGNNDIRFSRGAAPEAEYVKLTRVADDAGAGERTPGAMAASAELSRTTPTPLTTKGTRYVALPVSEMAALARYLKIGHAQLLRQDMPGGVSLKHKKLWIAADVLGTVDKTDMAAEKEILKRHGFFQQEDPGWLATHSPTEARRERFRSEDALAAKLEALADRRIAGKEPGGFAAGRKVFADQLAKVVMSMPHGQPGVLGAMQTVGGALEKRVRGDEAEADAFIGWMKGETTPPARSAQERKAEMFAAFLMMPQEMQARAPRWYDAMRSTIAGDAKLADAFRKMTARSMSEQAHAHLEAEISRTIDEQYELNVKKLRAEAEEPIKAGGAGDVAKEKIILAADDRMGAAIVRVDARTRLYEQAQKAAMAAAQTPEEKARIKQATDIFMGKIAQTKNQVELSRTAWERGRNNADMRYHYRMVDLLNEATVRDGLRLNDLSLYLDQKRVIETRGLSGSRGQSARQAQLVLDAMKARLGTDFAKIEAFARKFHAIHEQELLDNPLLEKVLGKGTAEYWRSQASYVTTKRTFSPEELAEIEAARRTLAASGAAGGDTVVGQMFNYCGRPKATSKLKGSFADKQEVMSATFEKVAEVQKFLRRSEYVIRLRDLLQLANVEGVHDFASGKNDFARNARYGAISYMENGQKRTLVVPREIADGFERQATYDAGAIKLCATVNNLARQLWIDWNPVYWQRNIARNIGSMEMNMPGMRESIVKRGARFVMPGLAPVTEIAMTHLVRHMPEKMSLPLRKIWGEHTALYYAPKAKRMAMWLTDHNEMQKKLWAAEKRGDLGAVQEMLQDQRDMLDALKANMLVGLSAGKASGTSGFLDDSVRALGKTMQRELNDFAARPKWRKALDAATWIFRKNSEQQVFEDVMAKFSAYLHDRAQFGSGNNRTLEESGLVVKKNVSIGEGERKGKNTGMVQALFQPFWNMVEKGVTRSVKAYGERPGETFQKAAWRIGPMLLQGLVGSGAVAAWILKAHDGDEAAAESGTLGDVYRYARNAQRAYQNCSNYVKENYHVTPLWTDGYTSIVIGMPLTDEERLLKPVARFVTDAASVAAGTKEQLEISGFLSDAFGTVAPDFKMAGAMVTLLDDTAHALLFDDNPLDYYTGGYKYDPQLYAARNESWEMRGKFAAAVGRRLWNDFGGRNVLPVERGGVDNGLGKAPGWVAKAVNEIPIASPILRSFVKVQVGSPKKDAAEILDTEKRRNAVIGVLAKELFETARREGQDISSDTARYVGKLEEWEKRYGFTPDELAKIEAKYLNAWREYDAAQWRADGEREKYRAKAEQLGLDAASIWLEFD